MKKAIQIVLAIMIVGAAYWLFTMIMAPLRFQETQKLREVAVIERLKDIRTAQRAFKQVNQRFTASFDTLINFVLHDSLQFKKAIGSADDSIAVAKGLVKEDVFKMAVMDTIFGARKLTPEQIQQFSVIPHTGGAKFIMDAAQFATESKVVVPVFVCKAPYKLLLSDLDHQELVNLIDEREMLGRYPGVKVGSLTEATNEAGNWE